MVLIFISGCKDDDPKPFKPTVTLSINHVWNDSLLVLNKQYYWEHNSKIDSITPTELIYHINNLKFYTLDSLKIDADQKYYMVDYNAKKVWPSDISFTAPMEGVKYYITSLEFTIGVADSITNSTGALNSTFISPMYWGMIQGYINFKFEGTSPQADKNTIIYHIGGYKKPFNNYRKVRVVFDKPYYLNMQNNLSITANLFKLFNSAHEMDISTNSLIHMPNADSKLVADNMANMYSFESFK